MNIIQIQPCENSGTNEVDQKTIPICRQPRSARNAVLSLEEVAITERSGLCRRPPLSIVARLHPLVSARLRLRSRIGEFAFPPTLRGVAI